MKNKAEGLRCRGVVMRLRRSVARWCIPHPAWLALVFILHPSSLILSSLSAQTPGPAATSVSGEVHRGPLTYDSFKLMHTRNVFDPDRRPVRPAAATDGRADYVAVTGTLLDGGKSHAFFSGSRTEFNKVLTVGDSIANSKLVQIETGSIVVERDGRRTTVGVGQTVPLDGKTTPGPAPVNMADVVAAPGGSGETTSGANAPVASGNAATAAPAAPGGKPATGSKEEMMRKMMERRQQELK